MSTALAIIGTNRKNGNISLMCEKVLEGLKEQGIQTEMLNLYDYQIDFCKGCWACSKTGKCVIEDDFEKIYKKITDSDIIILGSPVYWGNISAVLKNFFDRYTSKMTFPPGIHQIHEAPLLKKVKFALYALKHFGPREAENRNKNFILISASTIPVRYFMKEVPLTMKAMKICVGKCAGKVVGSLVYTDTLIQFRNKKIQMLKKAKNLGRKVGSRKLFSYTNTNKAN